MAVLVIDTANTREGGGPISPYFDGFCGRIVGFSFTVSTGNIWNCGPGVQWVMWENNSGTAPFTGTSSQLVAAIHDGVDRVVFTAPGGPNTGVLWVFYRMGAGDARGSTGGTTVNPTGVVEYAGRRAQSCRMSSWTSTAMTNGNTLVTFMSGAFHIGSRLLSTDTNTFDIRWASDGNHQTGRITVDASAANRTGHSVFFSRGFKGLDANGL